MIKRYQRTALSQYLVVGIILLALIGIGFFAIYLMNNVPFTDQFAIPWAAGRSWLLEGKNPYDTSIDSIAAQALNQSRFLGSLPEQRNLIHPIINLIFFLPFSVIPFEISRVLWVVLLTVCTFFASYFALKLSGWKILLVEKIGILTFSIVFLPAAFTILSGGLSPVIILLVFLSIYLIQNNQDTTAGFLLSLVFGSAPTTIVMLLFIIIWSISHRRWSVIISFLSGVAFLIAITVMMYPSWPMDWLRIMVMNFNNLEWVDTPMMHLAAILPGIESFLSIALHGIFGLYLLIILISSARRNVKEVFWFFSSICAIAILFQITSNVSIILLVYPGIYLVFKYWNARRGTLGRFISWVSVIILAVIPWIFLSPDKYFTQQKNLPILMIVLPLLTLFSLIWVRWWAMKIPELPYTH